MRVVAARIVGPVDEAVAVVVEAVVAGHQRVGLEGVGGVEAAGVGEVDEAVAVVVDAVAQARPAVMARIWSR